MSEMRDERKTALSNAVYEKMLGDVIELAESALADASGESETARAKQYKEALGKINGIMRPFRDGRTPLEYLRDEFGLEMRKYRGVNAVKIIGVRRHRDGNDCTRMVNDIWEISVDKQTKIGTIQKNGETFMRLLGTWSNMVEKCSVKTLITVLTENKRTSHHERVLRKQQKSWEVE